MSSFKRWMLTVLVAMLPLHGFAAAQMATGMAVGVAAWVADAHAPDHAHVGDTAMPCHDSMGNETQVAQTESDSTHCADCLSCAACHANALAATVALLPVAFDHGTQPVFIAQQAASVSLAQPTKPPKSQA